MHLDVIFTSFPRRWQVKLFAQRGKVTQHPLQTFFACFTENNKQANTLQAVIGGLNYYVLAMLTVYSAG